MQSTWSFWAAVWACPGCNWQFLPVFLLMFQFFLQLLILEFHVLQHFLEELTCVCFLMFQYWFTQEAATVWVEKCSKILWAEWTDWTSCMNEDKSGNAKRHCGGQTVSVLFLSVFVLIFLLSLCFSCTAKIYCQIKFTFPLLIYSRFTCFKQGKKLSYLSSLQSGQNCSFHLKLIQLVVLSLHTHSVIKWWLCWKHWNRMHHPEAMPLRSWLFLTEGET